MSIPNKTSSVWLLVADLHFHKDNLDRNKTTFSWIVSEFAARRPNNVIILGDVVHTRGQIHLRTYHELANFFKSLHDATWSPTIHVLIGNHDMLDKHSRVVNSMEIVGFASTRLRVYSEITRTTIDDVPCIFVPFHEDQSAIVEYLSTIPANDSGRTVVFAHAALNGAVINGISNHSNDICKNSGLNVQNLEGFRQTFLGHFHHHRTYGEKGNVTYVGAPAQFNFGDAGDLDRGIVLYDPVGNEHSFVASPHAEHFVRLSWAEATLVPDHPPSLVNIYENKSVSIRVPASSVADGTWNIEMEAKIRRNFRTNWGVSRVEMVRQSAEFAPCRNRKRPESSDDSTTVSDRKYLLQAAEDFVGGDASTDAVVRAKRIAYINRVIDEHHSETCTTSAASLFTADITHMTMKNFMGVQEPLTIHFDRLEPGVWLIRGRNGTGKSTFLEAIAWCLYGETFRQCNAHDIVNLVAEKTKKECSVTVHFSNGSMITRARKAGKPLLSFRGPHSDDVQERGVKNVGQSEIDAMLNIGWKRFARSVMLSSSTTLNFSTSKEVEKRAVIEHLLGFDVFTAYAAIADADLKQTQAQVSELTLQIGRSEEQVICLERQLNEHYAATFAQEQQLSSGKAEIRRLKLQSCQIEEDVCRLKNTLSERRQHRDKVQKMLDTILERQEYTRARFTSQLDDVDALRLKIETDRETRIKDVELELCGLRNESSTTQKLLDECYASYAQKIVAMENEENELYDRALHQRAVEKKELVVQNAVDKLSALQMALRLRAQENAANKLSLIEQAASDLHVSIETKNFDGGLGLDEEVYGLEKDVINPLREYIRESCGVKMHDELVEQIRNQQAVVESRQLELNLMGASDPSVDEFLRNARARPRVFADVDPSNYELWAEGNDRKSVMERRIAQCERNLRQLTKTQYTGSETLRIRCDKAEKELANWRKELVCLQNDADDVRASLTADSGDGALSLMLSESTALTIRIKEIEAVNVQLGLQIDALALDIDRLKQSKTETLDALQTLEAERNGLELERAIIGFWKEKLRCAKTTGFRSFCIERKVHEINEEVDRNMHIIGDDGDGLFVDLGCKLTPSLSLVEKDDAVPFKRRSDGQKKRSELALFFAIVKKAKEEGGFYPKFMFLDEIYDSLDEKGQVAVHRWIEQNTSVEQGEKTFVITHSPAVEATHRAKICGVISTDWTEHGSAYGIDNDEQLSKKVFVRNK